MRRIVLLSLIPASIGFLPAEQTQLSGPVEGFTFDAPTGSFRAVIGLPGSASLGPAILDDFGSGSVAPQKDYGLAFRDGKCAIVSGLSGANPVVSAFSGVRGNPEGIEWSGDGSLAFVFSRSANWIQILSGLPNSPTPQVSVDLSFLSGSLSSIAADTPGRRLALGIAGEPGGVYLVTDGGDPVPILASSKPIALAFSDDGREFYALDGATLQLTQRHLSDFTSHLFSLDGLRDPVAIRSIRHASGREMLYVAGRNDSMLREYDAASRQILSDLPLDFSPTELRDFGRNSFLLAPRKSSGDPLWLFTTTPQQAVYFVPSAPAASGGAPQ
jgi:hypothetical protein